MKKLTYKIWLSAALAACVLTLSACADKGAKTSEEDPKEDAQTEIEQEATDVDDVEQVNTNVNSADTSNDPLVNDDVAVASADDDVAVAGVDDSEIMDGTGQEEHVSTY